MFEIQDQELTQNVSQTAASSPYAKQRNTGYIFIHSQLTIRRLS